MTKVNFRCDLCGNTAATVKFFPKACKIIISFLRHHTITIFFNSPSFINYEFPHYRFHFLGVYRKVLEPRDVLVKALMECNPSALYDFEGSLAPYYCHECALSYYSRHWIIMPDCYEGITHYDYFYGTCPKGHLRIIADCETPMDWEDFATAVKDRG